MSRFKGASRNRLNEDLAQSNNYHTTLQLEVVKGLLQDSEKSRDWYKLRADLLQHKVEQQEAEIESLKKKCQEYYKEIRKSKTRQQQMVPIEYPDLHTVKSNLEESIRLEKEKLCKIRQENNCLKSIIGRHGAMNHRPESIHDKLPSGHWKQDEQDGYLSEDL